MTILSWLRRVLYHRVDFHGGVGGECVDLANDYITAVWAADPVRLNAQDWDNADLPNWAYVRNVENAPGAPGNYPPFGAVIVWHGPLPILGMGAMGHVSVAMQADPHYIVSADQNWGSVKSAALTLHDYRGVHGWWTRRPQ